MRSLTTLKDMWFNLFADVENQSAQFSEANPTTLSAGDAAIITFGVIFFLVALLLVRVLLRKDIPDQTGGSLAHVTRSARWLGLIVALLFFGVFGGWAAHAPLSSAAVAPGVVSPDGSRKTVQHLEGGIIERIHVREGQKVTSGETLITLENVRALARLDELRERLIFLLATEARLIAEINEQSVVSFNFPDTLTEVAPAQVEIAQKGQKQLFESRRDSLSAQARILAKRIDQLNEEIAGLDEVILAQNEQLSLLTQEIDVTRGLYEQGLQRLSPLLTLQRQEADLKAERASNRASIARLGQQIGETELQLSALNQQTREEVSEELSRVRNEVATLRSQLPERQDALRRTTVVAPISGQVLNIKVTTESGGVLRPGDAILDIVPDDSVMIIDARVSPQDIDTVYPGMQAQVLLTAYTQRNLPRLYGALQSISADRLVDERTGEPYFLAKVTVRAEEVAAMGDAVSLSVGMPADVMLLTGERTVLDYLITPFVDSLRASFRES